MQRRNSGSTVALAALLLAGASFLAIGPGLAAPPDSPWGADYFPNVELTTQDGVKVRFYDDLLKGKTVAINVMWTHCIDACPLETARLLQVKRLLGDRVGRDIFFYSISIDPKRDTPAVLKAYAEKFGTGPGWLFLTGKMKDINMIRKKLGLSSTNDAKSRDGHAPTLAVGDVASGQWMRNSAVDNPRFLATKINAFLGDWPQGKNYAEARPLDIHPGEYVFASMCGACHTVGKGDKVGPDLRGVTARRDPAWLFRYIKAPERMRAANDPISKQLFATYKVRMPDLGMADGDVHEVIKYLDTRSASVHDAKRKDTAGEMTAEVEKGSANAGAHHEHHHHGNSTTAEAEEAEKSSSHDAAHHEHHHHGGGAHAEGAKKP
jgi:protein SCO1/2